MDPHDVNVHSWSSNRWYLDLLVSFKLFLVLNFDFLNLDQGSLILSYMILSFHVHLIRQFFSSFTHSNLKVNSYLKMDPFYTQMLLLLQVLLI